LVEDLPYKQVSYVSFFFTVGRKSVCESQTQLGILAEAVFNQSFVRVGAAAARFGAQVVCERVQIWFMV
jgi:hypothetical protein